MAKHKTFKWTVEFEVDETWVADGFDLTDERANDMIQETLSYATSSEVKAKVIKAPSVESIRKAQGYKETTMKPPIKCTSTRVTIEGARVQSPRG